MKFCLLSPRIVCRLEEKMPEITRFFGIIIRMFFEAGEPHHSPHFHAYYQKEVAVYRIEEIELVGGNLPRRQRRLVEAWAEIHQDQLLSNWNRLQSGDLPEKIEPLK